MRPMAIGSLMLASLGMLASSIALPSAASGVTVDNPTGPILGFHVGIFQVGLGGGVRL